MSELTTQQKTLSAQWAALHEGAGQALAWIADVRGNAPRLDSEGDGLNLRLHRARNQAAHFARAATTPMTVGFFGLSQAGKSYLISTLAANTAGRLETELGGERLDFLDNINPIGTGKEATGLVTRFSRRAQPSPDAAFPVELKLFSEVEIAKILANSWFKDFDQEQVTYSIDEARIQSILKPFEGFEANAVVPGLSGDDVVSLWDYLQENFKSSVSKLHHLYWPRVIKLAPHLSIAQRAELFSILWGQQPELTRVYEKLGSALRNLGHSRTVYAPLSALVSRNASGELSKNDSIMSVDILSRLDTSLDSSIDVRPVLANGLGDRVALTVAQLATLTAEMTFRLVNPPQDPVIDQVDVLDFPGYRARMNMRSLAETAAATSGGAATAISQMLLRGKVAYLFERYTECQEMNALVLCTNSEKQIEVPQVVPVITRWIEKTQGVDPGERAKRGGVGLIWALTMLDKRIGDILDTPAADRDSSWGNMMHLSMLERFGTLSWMNDWAGQPFQNTFLMRKPRMRTSFIEVCENTGNELHIKPAAQPLLDGLGEALVANERVIKHIHSPADAWQAVLKINDGGITRFSRSFADIANTEFKLQRISDEYTRCIHDLLPNGISPWYHKDGDGAVALKRTQAQMILSQLGKNLSVLGELISHLQVPGESIRDLYLSGVYDDDADTDAAADPEQPAQPQSLYGNSASLDFGDSLMFGLGDDSPSDAPPASVTVQPELQGSEHRFAKAVFKEWVAYLRDVPNRDHLLHGLGLNKKVIEAAVDEIITAAYRLDLPGQVASAVLKRAQSGARRDQLVERQVLEVQLVLRDFVAWFGFVHNPVAQRPKSLVGSRDHLFAYYRDVAVGQLPELPPQAIDQAQVFLGDWLSGLATITLANAGHGAGREISPEQNERLGRVLTTFQAS